MIQVYEGLWCGSQPDYETGNFDLDKWAFVLAAKEPWHRSCLGYTGRACDKTHPEYLFARRENKLILNLVDAPKPEFFAKEIFDHVMSFIDEQIILGKKVLVCCNKGESRSASICMIYCISKTVKVQGSLADFEMAEEFFKRYYPPYNPSTGIREFMRLHWNDYSRGGDDK